MCMVHKVNNRVGGHSGLVTASAYTASVVVPHRIMPPDGRTWGTRTPPATLTDADTRHKVYL